jgi:hypothetical protein
MQKTKKSQLARALRGKLLVRFASALERGTASGYVLDIGPQFFLLALVSDGIRFNGFQCYRMSDVRRLQVPDKYALFHEAVLNKRGERRPKKPPVVVSSLSELLLSANRAFPLVTIHRETGFTAPFVRRNLAQSNIVAQRSITVVSKLSSGFLKRNFLFFLVPGWLAAKIWHFASSCSNTVRCNCQGRCSLA